MASDFSLRFWGVRGSIACSGPRTVRYGGNTSCIEVRCGERLLIFDGGTGMRYLGNALKDQVDADLFLTHTHFDHVCGLPFFRPFFEPKNRWRLWAGHLAEGMTLRRVLGEFMMSPLFPVPPQVFRARMEYREFKAGDTLQAGPQVAVRTAPLNHPDGATGYRIEYAGRSLCYLTDTEHVPGAPDRNILELIAGADLVIYDSTYTDAEYDTLRRLGPLHLAGRRAPVPRRRREAPCRVPPRPRARRRHARRHRARRGEGAAGLVSGEGWPRS